MKNIILLAILITLIAAGIAYRLTLPHLQQTDKKLVLPILKDIKLK